MLNAVNEITIEGISQSLIARKLLESHRRHELCRILRHYDLNVSVLLYERGCKFAGLVACDTAGNSQNYILALEHDIYLPYRLFPMLLL